MIGFTVLMTLVTLSVYIVSRQKVVMGVSGSMRASAIANAVTRYAYNHLYASLALMLVLSAVLLFAIGENLMFLIPLFCGTVAMSLYHLTSLRLWLPVAITFILLHAFSFLYALTMALTIGAFGAVAMLAFLDLMVLIPLADLYMVPSRK